MHPTRIDLSGKARARVVELLNARLADALDLQLQAKQAHWNVKGPNFIALHELFDKIAGEVSEHVDEMAERITALGGMAEGTVQAIGGPFAPGALSARHHGRPRAPRGARDGAGPLRQGSAQGHRRFREGR